MKNSYTLIVETFSRIVIIFLIAFFIGDTITNPFWVISLGILFMLWSMNHLVEYVIEDIKKEKKENE